MIKCHPCKWKACPDIETFPQLEWGSNPGNLVSEARVLTTELSCFLHLITVTYRFLIFL